MSETAFAFVRRTLARLETTLGVSITVIDHAGVFRSPTGAPCLGADWQSHRKNPLCRLGFDRRCIAHCRHAVGARGERERAPFVTRCWKGVREVAVPLFHEDLFLGTLFAGQWREARLPAGGRKLPPGWAEAYLARLVLDEKAAAGLGELLTVFAEGLLKRLASVITASGGGGGRRGEIRRFIHFQAGRPAGLADLAAALHLSPGRTSHLVRELFGVSLKELLIRERVNAAKALLLATDLPVGEVARRAGWNDASRFCRLFKQATGLTPARFRRTGSG